jgi:iron only hydrogenase large subunit-like protein
MGNYFHTIVVDKEKCTGCMKCMRVCPTEAIRVRNGIATILEERCVDCGQCVAVCPYNARNGLTDTISKLKESKYKYKIALPSPVLYSQFGKNVLPNDILNAFLRIGFDEAYDVSYMCEVHNHLIRDYVARQPDDTITISSMCPVVVRLIQFKYPQLVSLLFPMENPRSIAAMKLKAERSRRLCLSPHEIQTVYITPCPAKMISINQPQCKQISYLDGAISIAEIYGSLLHALSDHKKVEQSLHRSGGVGISRGMIGGEIRGLNPETSLAVDGMINVMGVLEDIEAERIKGIKFVELRSCTGGCIGGSFTVENQYLARNKIVRLIRNFGKESRAQPEDIQYAQEEGNLYCDVSLKGPSIDLLDREPQAALKKLKERDTLLVNLPGIDCGVCGAPTCKSFAEDVIQGRSRPEDCHFHKGTRTREPARGN